MAASVGLHIAAMFPPYSGNPATPVVQLPYETAVYICLEVGWALAALAVISRFAARGGVALGATLGTIEVGFLVTDLATGFDVSNGSAAGVWLAIAGLAAGLAGVLYGGAAVLSSGPGSPRVLGQAADRDHGTALAHEPAGERATLASAATSVRVALSVLAAIAAVAAFWPSWDHYHLVTAAGQVTNINLGNAFNQPAAIMAGEVFAGIAIGVTALVAALWRDPLVGAWGLAGTVIALASQVASGMVQASEPLTKLLPATTASQVNLSSSSVSLTTYWYIDLGAAVALALLAIWAALDGLRARRTHAVSGGAEGPTGSQSW